LICCLHPGKQARPLKNHKKKIRGRKARTFCFRNTSFVHPRSGTYYALFLGCFGMKLLPEVLHCVYWVLAEISVPDSSHKICNNFFVPHYQDWKEGSCVWETVWFFSWANTHPFDLKFIAFCPKFNGDCYVKFLEKNISGEFFRNFVQTKAILYRNLWNFALLSELLFWIRIGLKKFTQVLSYVVLTQVRSTSIKKSQKEDTGGKARTFCFRKTSFVHRRSGTYYALFLGCFGMKLLPEVLHCVCWVLAEISVPDSSHKIGNNFFVPHCQDWKEGSCVWETVWFFSWANTHPFDLKFVAFCPKFNGDCYVKFLEKTISGEFFRNFVQTKAILYRNLWNFALLSEILFWIRIGLKKFTQVLSYVVFTQVRRHVHKKITKRRYGGKS